MKIPVSQKFVYKIEGDIEDGMQAMRAFAKHMCVALRVVDNSDPQNPTLEFSEKAARVREAISIACASDPTMTVH